MRGKIPFTLLNLGIVASQEIVVYYKRRWLAHRKNRKDDSVIKVNIWDLQPRESMILEIAFETDEIEFENEVEVYDLSEVIGYNKAAEIVSIYGWSEAQELADEFGISAPLANIEAVASAIVADLVMTYGEEA